MFGWQMIALRATFAVLLVATLLLVGLPVIPSIIFGTTGASWTIDGVVWVRRRRT